MLCNELYRPTTGATSRCNRAAPQPERLIDNAAEAVAFSATGTAGCANDDIDGEQES